VKVNNRTTNRQAALPWFEGNDRADLRTVPVFLINMSLGGLATLRSSQLRIKHITGQRFKWVFICCVPHCCIQGACDLPAGPYPTCSSNVPVVQAYYSSKYLGLIKVNLSKRKLVPGVQPLLLGGANSSNNVQQDPQLLSILQKYREPVDKLQTQVAGESAHGLLCTSESVAVSMRSWHSQREYSRCI